MICVSDASVFSPLKQSSANMSSFNRSKSIRSSIVEVQSLNDPWVIFCQLSYQIRISGVTINGNVLVLTVVDTQ